MPVNTIATARWRWNMMAEPLRVGGAPGPSGAVSPQITAKATTAPSGHLVVTPSLGLMLAPTPLAADAQSAGATGGQLDGEPDGDELLLDEELLGGAPHGPWLKLNWPDQPA
jgi:hypothetical protein